MAIIAKYKFNSSLYSDYLPIFNDEFTGYTKTDVNNGDGTITRTISHDTLKPTYMRFGVAMNSSTDREKSLIEVIECDTSEVTNMGNMFFGCHSLISLNVSNFNTSKATNMQYMFNDCKLLTSLDLSNFDTSKVTNFDSIFENCTSLATINVSSWDTSKVTNMAYMFNNCNKLTSLDVSNFNTSQVTNMRNMFASCSKLTTLDLSNFDTSQVTNMSWMFNGCNKLTTLDLSNFDTSQVTDMTSMLSNCTASDIGLLYATSATTNSLVTQLGTDVARNIYYMDAPLSELTVQDNITYKKYELSKATFPYTLNKLPNGVADYIDVVNKVHVQRVGKIVLDGTQTFTYSSQHSNVYYYGYIMTLSSKRFAANAAYGLCDKIQYKRNYNFPWSTDGDYVVAAGNQLFIKLTKDKLNSNNTVSSLTNYLTSNPITVLYELATPIYTPLTEEQIAQLPLSAYKDGYVNLSSDQLTPSFEFRMRASNRYQVDMLETGYYYLNAPVGNIKLGTASVDVQQMPCIVKVDNVGTGDSGYRLGLGGEITDTIPITLAKLPSHRIPTSFTQGIKCRTDFGYWGGIKESNFNRLWSTNSDWKMYDDTKLSSDSNVKLNRIEISSMSLIIEDEFDIATGKFTKRVGKVVFDGSSDESWSVASRSNLVKTVFFRTLLPTKSRENYICINDRMPYAVGWDSDVERLWIDNKDTLTIHTDKAFSVDSFKKYLASNPITVYYPLEVPEISYLSLTKNIVKMPTNSKSIQINNFSDYLTPQVKPSHLTYPVPSLVGNRTYTVVHNRKNITGSTKPITLDLGGTQVELNDASGKTLVKTPSTLKHSSLIFIGGESTVDHVMVLDGDWTNKPIEYFENMKGHDTDAIITIMGDGKIDDVAEQYLW